MFFVTNSNADNVGALFALKAMLVLWEIGATVAILMYPRIYYVIHPPPSGFFDTQQRAPSLMMQHHNNHSLMLHTPNAGTPPNGSPVAGGWPKSVTVQTPGGNSAPALGHRGSGGTNSLHLPHNNSGSRDAPGGPPSAHLATGSPDHRGSGGGINHMAMVHRPPAAGSGGGGTASASARGTGSPLFTDVRAQLAMYNNISPLHNSNGLNATTGNNSGNNSKHNDDNCTPTSTTPAPPTAINVNLNSNSSANVNDPKPSPTHAWAPPLPSPSITKPSSNGVVPSNRRSWSQSMTHAATLAATSAANTAVVAPAPIAMNNNTRRGSRPVSATANNSNNGNGRRLGSTHHLQSNGSSASVPPTSSPSLTNTTIPASTTATIAMTPNVPSRSMMSPSSLMIGIGSPSSVVHTTATTEPNTATSRDRLVATLEAEVNKRRDDMDSVAISSESANEASLPVRARVDSVVMAGPVFAGHRTSLIGTALIGGVNDDSSSMITTNNGVARLESETSSQSVNPATEPDIMVSSLRATQYNLEATIAAAIVTDGMVRDPNVTSAPVEGVLHFPSSSTTPPRPSASGAIVAIDKTDRLLPSSITSRPPFLHAVATPQSAIADLR
jgi:hypothetical protein